MLTKNDSKTYVSILGDGSLRVQVQEGTPDAVRREFEKSDGTKGVKHELVYDALSGKITNVSFFEGDYGKLLQVKITDKGSSVYLSLSTSLNFGEDLMKKLPNINLDEDVKLVPYSFEDDNGKTKKGITVYQNKEKVKNFFFDADNKKNINGYPDPEGDIGKYDSDDWKLYFISARKFLVEYTEKNCKVFNSEEPTVEETPATSEAADDVNPNEIPF